MKLIQFTNSRATDSFQRIKLSAMKTLKWVLYLKYRKQSADKHFIKSGQKCQMLQYATYISLKSSVIMLFFCIILPLCIHFAHFHFECRILMAFKYYQRDQIGKFPHKSTLSNTIYRHSKLFHIWNKIP